MLSLKLLLGSLLFFLFVRPISAQSFTDPVAYEITPGIPQRPATQGEIFFTKELDINYKEGPVIFSGTIEGSIAASILVDDGSTVTVTNPNDIEGIYEEQYHFNCFFRQPKPGQDISHLFSKGINHVKVILYDVCGGFIYSDPLYLVTERADLLPSDPVPFLDLPWDYNDKDFKQIIFNPNSWFDHKYPLQDHRCCVREAVNYKGHSDKFYKSHSGYDYGSPHGIDKDTLVKATAAGEATFVAEKNSGGAGNMIKIDHKNGYQTWYEHLEEATPGSELFIDKEGEGKQINPGDTIGRVGLTGRTTGYHIHLSVFKDINNNGDFEDDYPFGLVDPLGWEGNYTDPWEEYHNNDHSKHGAKSYKLFTQLPTSKTQQLGPSGGKIIYDELTLDVPENASSATLNYKIEHGPFEEISKTLKSVVPSIFLFATNNLGQMITNFNNPLSLVYNYSKADLSNINEDTLSFYFFNEGNKLWEKIPSTLDKTNKTISAPTTHFSQFAVMGELLDSTPASTSAKLAGEKGAGNWYRSDVTVSLLASDNPGGKGVSYTVYSLDGEQFEEYLQPLQFNTDGNYKINFLSHDLAGNEEPIKSIEFSIDKTLPEAKIEVDQVDWDLKVLPIATDSALTKKSGKKLGETIYTLKDQAGNTLTMETQGLDSQYIDLLKINSLKYNENPKTLLPDNLLDVNYIFYTPKRRPEIKVINQNFAIKDKVGFVIIADSIKNKTILNILENGTKRKEEKPGLTLLKLKTNQGKLEYSY